MIEAVDLHALDRWTGVILEARQADFEFVCEIGTREIARTRQASRDFQGRQRAQPRFPRNLNGSIFTHGLGEYPVVVCNPQPVRNPQMPMRLTRKVCDRQVFEKFGRALPQACQASTGVIARAVRPTIPFHLCLRTAPSAIARTCRPRVQRSALHACSTRSQTCFASHSEDTGRNDLQSRRTGLDIKSTPAQFHRHVSAPLLITVMRPGPTLPLLCVLAL